MKTWPVIGLLFTTAVIATIPISPQVTLRGVELSVDQAQAEHHHRVYRRAYVGSYYSCAYYGIPSYWEIPGCYGYPANYFGDRSWVWRSGAADRDEHREAARPARGHGCGLMATRVS